MFHSQLSANLKSRKSYADDLVAVMHSSDLPELSKSTKVGGKVSAQRKILSSYRTACALDDNFMNHTHVKVTKDKECDTLQHWLLIWLLKDAAPTANTRKKTPQ